MKPASWASSPNWKDESAGEKNLVSFTAVQAQIISAYFVPLCSTISTPLLLILVNIQHFIRGQEAFGVARTRAKSARASFAGLRSQPAPHQTPFRTCDTTVDKMVRRFDVARELYQLRLDKDQPVQRIVRG